MEDHTLMESKYVLGRKLGQGSFGTVRILFDKSNDTIVHACKMIRKKRGSRLSYEQQQREVAIMKIVRHRHIVQLREVFETPKKVFLVMEFCEGGELVEKIRMRRYCSEPDARVIMTRIADAVGYLHDHGVVHRDIKPENILLSTEDPSDPFNLKLSDFGLATFTDKCTMMANVVGTPLYMDTLYSQGESEDCTDASLNTTVLDLMKNFNTLRRFRKALHVIQAAIRFRGMDRWVSPPFSPPTTSHSSNSGGSKYSNLPSLRKTGGSFSTYASATAASSNRSSTYASSMGHMNVVGGGGSRGSLFSLGSSESKESLSHSREDFGEDVITSANTAANAGTSIGGGVLSAGLNTIGVSPGGGAGLGLRRSKTVSSSPSAATSSRGNGGVSMTGFGKSLSKPSLAKGNPSMSKSHGDTFSPASVAITTTTYDFGSSPPSKTPFEPRLIPTLNSGSRGHLARKSQIMDLPNEPSNNPSKTVKKEAPQSGLPSRRKTTLDTSNSGTSSFAQRPGSSRVHNNAGGDTQQAYSKSMGKGLNHHHQAGSTDIHKPGTTKGNLGGVGVKKSQKLTSASVSSLAEEGGVGGYARKGEAGFVTRPGVSMGLGGRGGYNTEWCKHLLPEVLKSTLPPAIPGGIQPEIKLITIFLGANDAVLPGLRQHVSLPKYKANLFEMLETVRKISPNTRIILITPPPVDPERWGRPDRTVEHTKKYRDACIEVTHEAKTTHGYGDQLTFVDTWEVFLGKGNGDKPYTMDQVKDMLSDGLHLASKGNILLYEALMATIKTQWPDLYPDNIRSRVPWHDKVDVDDLKNSLFALP
ncbi:Serine/threonine-protein kinase 33 [Chytridiales sp. JEL 0842]|nr:Serine/threonine-protein kinase 33 [Chytridiales sp. JEL 0842]